MDQRPPTIAQWQCTPIIVVHLLVVAVAVVCVLHDVRNARQWTWVCCTSGATLALSAVIATGRPVILACIGLSTNVLCAVLLVIENKLRLGGEFWRSWFWTVPLPYDVVLVVVSLIAIWILRPPHERRFQFSTRFLIVQIIALSLAFASYRALIGMPYGHQLSSRLALPGDVLDFRPRLNWQVSTAIAIFVYACACTIDSLYCALRDGIKASKCAAPPSVRRDERELSSQE